jgi:hypothetical protein
MSIYVITEEATVGNLSKGVSKDVYIFMFMYIHISFGDMYICKYKFVHIYVSVHIHIYMNIYVITEEGTVRNLFKGIPK